MGGEGAFSGEFSRKGTYMQKQSIPPSGDDTGIIIAMTCILADVA